MTSPSQLVPLRKSVYLLLIIIIIIIIIKKCNYLNLPIIDFHDNNITTKWGRGEAVVGKEGRKDKQSGCQARSKPSPNISLYDRRPKADDLGAINLWYVLSEHYFAIRNIGRIQHH